ncbi:MAG TPA: TIGR03617 family F420-dependent LLM class oxidoreductase [Solirubrobacteraceae bacterium]
MEYAIRIQDTSSAERIAAAARQAQSVGMVGLWCGEAGRDPFLPLGFAAQATTSLLVGTGIAVAYARSPYAVAQTAWDLQRISHGRMRLGLGTQVRAHVERRFGMPWPGGVAAMREYVLVLRAVWHAFRTAERPSFEGNIWRFTLLNPEFLPEASEEVRPIPVWIAAVGRRNAHLAGEVGDGIHVHAFHTEAFLRDVLIPAARRGREEAGRTDPVQATCPVFAAIVHGEDDIRRYRDYFRRQIAFYGSTKEYLPVLTHSGLEHLHPALRDLAREGRWDEMASQVDDEVVDAFVVLDEPVALGRRLREKYDGLLTELALYRRAGEDADGEDLAMLISGLRGPGVAAPAPGPAQ